MTDDPNLADEQLAAERRRMAGAGRRHPPLGSRPPTSARQGPFADAAAPHPGRRGPLHIPHTRNRRNTSHPPEPEPGELSPLAALLRQAEASQGTPEPAAGPESAEPAVTERAENRSDKP